MPMITLLSELKMNLQKCLLEIHTFNPITKETEVGVRPGLSTKKVPGLHNGNPVERGEREKERQRGNDASELDCCRTYAAHASHTFYE